MIIDWVPICLGVHNNYVLCVCWWEWSTWNCFGWIRGEGERASGETTINHYDDDVPCVGISDKYDKFTFFIRNLFKWLSHTESPARNYHSNCNWCACVPHLLIRRREITRNEIERVETLTECVRIELVNAYRAPANRSKIYKKKLNKTNQTVQKNRQRVKRWRKKLSLSSHYHHFLFKYRERKKKT